MDTFRPVTPDDRSTQHRWHWVQKNDYEIWEWRGHGQWMRTGCERWLSEGDAGKAGFKYVGEVRPPVTETIIPVQQAKVDVTASEIKVRVNGIPHIMLRRSDVVGVQGYIKNIGPVVPIYFIEITTKSSQVVCDYSDRGLWEDILGGMADARMFDERMGEPQASA